MNKHLSGMVGTSSSMVSSHFSRIKPTKFHQIVNQHVIWNSAFDFKLPISLSGNTISLSEHLVNDTAHCKVKLVSPITARVPPRNVMIYSDIYPWSYIYIHVRLDLQKYTHARTPTHIYANTQTHAQT